MLQQPRKLQNQPLSRLPFFLNPKIITDKKSTDENKKTVETSATAENDIKTSKADITFEADTIVVEQENNIMSASGNVRIMQKGDLLEANLITYNQLTGVAKAIGGVKAKDKNGTEHLAQEMVFDENFARAVATPLVSTLADGSRFSSEKGEHRQQKRTSFDRSVFSPCNCDYENGETPIWDLKATKSDYNIEAQTITHNNVRMNIFDYRSSIFRFWLTQMRL